MGLISGGHLDSSLIQEDLGEANESEAEVDCLVGSQESERDAVEKGPEHLLRLCRETDGENGSAIDIDGLWEVNTQRGRNAIGYSLRWDIPTKDATSLRTIMAGMKTARSILPGFWNRRGRRAISSAQVKRNMKTV